jgi:hypothetical protein
MTDDTTGALVVQGDSAVAVADARLQRFETTVTLPPNFQYIVGKGEKARRSITSDGYDYMNRSLGAMFYLPDLVPDEVGDMVRNPIHRPDYIYMRMTAVWRNENGQLIAATEDLEVDFKAVYQQARLETWNSEVALDESGQPIFGADGQPLIKVTSDSGGNYPKSANEKERDALKVLMSLRSTGLRYAQTVLRTRLLKVATGIKTLPGNQVGTVKVRVVGWRDEMNPQERQDAAEQAMGGMFRARPADAPSLSPAEMRTIEGEDPEFSGVPMDDAAPGPATADPEPPERHLDDRAAFEAIKTTTVDASTMTQEEMEEVIAAEYEQMQASMKSR